MIIQLGFMRGGLGIVLLISLLFLSVQSVAQPLAWRYPIVNSVTSLSITSDGKYVAAGNEDGFIYFLDREKGKELWKYASWSNINAISVSDDGSYLAAGGSNRFVYLFDKDFSGNSFLWRYSLGASVLSLAISGDGRHIAAGSFDQSVYFFDRESSDPLWSNKIDGMVRCVDISKEGEFVSAGSDDGYVYVFDREYSRNTFISRFKTNEAVASLSISKGGYCIAAGSLDGYIYFQDRKTDTDTYTWRHKAESRITSISMSAEGDYIVAGDSSGKIYFFDRGYSGNNCLWSYPIGTKSTTISISEDGSLLASGCENGIYLFDKDFINRSFLWYLPSSSDITNVKISGDGYSVIAGDEEGYVYMFWPAIQPIETVIEKTSIIETTSVKEEPSLSTKPGTLGEIKWIPEAWYSLMIIVSLATVGIAYLLFKRKRIDLEPISKKPVEYSPIDYLLKGSVPKGYSVVLSSPPCDQRDEMIRVYIKAGLERELNVYVSNTADRILEFADSPNLYTVVCNPQAEDITPKLGNIEKIASTENLTELNINLMNVMDKIHSKRKGPIRICLDILDDVLLQHRGLTTRKWLLELIPRLKKMGGTILAVLNPKMHPKEDLNAVLSLFDGQLDVTEEKKKGKVSRKISVLRMYGLSYSKKEVQI